MKEQSLSNKARSIGTKVDLLAVSKPCLELDLQDSTSNVSPCALGHVPHGEKKIYTGNMREFYFPYCLSSPLGCT